MTVPTVEQTARINATRWADPLTSRERAELAKLLARACGRSWRASGGARRKPLVVLSIEMSAVYLDVTGRAKRGAV